MTNPREIDAEIYQKVMGQKIAAAPIITNIRRYSTDINAAFEAVEKMREKGWLWECGSSSQSGGPKHYHATFERDIDFTKEISLKHTWVADATLPMAICLCALKALKSIEGE